MFFINCKFQIFVGCQSGISFRVIFLLFRHFLVQYIYSNCILIMYFCGASFLLFLFYFIWMNYFDIVAGILLILAVIKGLKNGLIIELASLVALVVGLFGAIEFSSITEAYLIEHIDSSYIGVVAFIITFVLIVVGVHLLAKVVDKLVSAIALGMVNRVLGALFSLLKYAFIMSVVVAILGSFEQTYSVIPNEQKENSKLYEPIRSIAPSVFPYLRFDEVREQIDNAKRSINI